MDSGGDYFSDSLSLTDMKDKAGAEKLQDFWILELGELAGMKKADVETVKSFISRTDDDYRPSYGKVVESHPRQCIIVGSTNSETGFLRDITGNRRFWPIHVTGNSVKKSWDMTRQDIDQLWAVAVRSEAHRLLCAVHADDESQRLGEGRTQKAVPDLWGTAVLSPRVTSPSGP